VSELVAILSGLAALFAERGVVLARRGGARARLVPAGRPDRGGTSASIDRRAFLAPFMLAAAGMLVLGPGGAVAGAALAIVVRRRSTRRGRGPTIERLQEQLADAIAAIASAVRSGMSVPQAISYAADEADPPVKDHLMRITADVGVGMPVTDAVSEWAERVGSDDARLVSGALDLHRRSGGDLPAVLDQVATAVRERVAVGREVRTLTAQARLSGLILGLLPVGFFAFLWVTSRRDIQGALGTPLGLGSVALGLVLEGAAFLWIRRLLEIA
jgi:tight adherence protein B